MGDLIEQQRQKAETCVSLLDKQAVIIEEGIRLELCFVDICEQLKDATEDLPAEDHVHVSL